MNTEQHIDLPKFSSKVDDIDKVDKYRKHTIKEKYVAGYSIERLSAEYNITTDVVKLILNS